MRTSGLRGPEHCRLPGVPFRMTPHPALVGTFSLACEGSLAPTIGQPTIIAPEETLRSIQDPNCKYRPLPPGTLSASASGYASHAAETLAYGTGIPRAISYAGRAGCGSSTLATMSEM
jgi:hypothetical protein